LESKVIFRDYQEQQAQDHNDLQDYAERSFDHLVLDAVTAERRFAGFQVTKTGQAEVQISPGRMYDVLGVIYALNTTTTQSMVSYLAAAYKRYVLLTAVGSEVESDVEERDFLISASTDATEARAVATTRARTAVLTFTQGVESADPVAPATPVGHVAIAHIKLDTTQVVGIEVIEANKVASTNELDLRTDDLETFEALIGPKIASLASDIAALRRRLDELGDMRSMQRIAEDVARVKESLKFPPTASDYDADFFLLPRKADYQNTLLFGYNALVEEGCRFADANADEFEIALFSANDPNATVSNGLLLPKFTNLLKIATSYDNSATSELGISQYGFQTIEMKQGYMSRTRLRYGGGRGICSNGTWWTWGGDPAPAALYDFETWNIVALTDLGNWFDPTNPSHVGLRYDSWWLDTWKEPYMYAQTVDHTITGAMVAQSFLVPNDMWLTQVDIFVTAKGANEDVHLAVCEMIAGVPDLSRTIAKTVLAQAQIAANTWNSFAVQPTFLKKGAKYALVLVSNANHKVGMVSGQVYIDGTFFYSTDGIYYQGDLSKDMMFRLWGARFNNPQSTVEFEVMNLDGGLRLIDILAEMWVPESAAVIWEIRPNGAGEWIPLVRDNADTTLATAPPLVQFRARFDGTRDMQGAIKLTGSRVHISRPKTTFTHVSIPFDLVTPSDEIHVKVTLEKFNDTPHDHNCVIRTGSSLATVETADTVTTKLLDAAEGRYEREYVFNLAGGNVSHFAIIQTGTTSSAQLTFHVAERTYYAA
jgi:hypothetical protein